jgi:hypothetical protein
MTTKAELLAQLDTAAVGHHRLMSDNLDQR